MYLLRKQAGLWVAVLTIFISCVSGGPLTPEDSFHDLRRAFASQDAVLLKKIISRDSLAKMKKIIAHISTMSEEQKSGISALYGIPRERLETITPDDFCSLYIVTQNKGPMGQALRSDIVSREQQGDHVIMSVASGVRFSFVKEGPYWKFDLTGL
ncbi:MAG: hypothetical protein CVV44_05800 [Spirochaetae bacterium HGW-Spirochaetae-1]|jgi:hypothetical protein|nr:MAG: hypothetical protein CVV44_05800 [Spirochaetae bacterium HGW-Spirochaetae-1]